MTNSPPHPKPGNEPKKLVQASASEETAAGAPPGGSDSGEGAGARGMGAAKNRRVRSSDLFGNAARITIEHGDHEYVLMVTKNGRLLLNRFS